MIVRPTSRASLAVSACLLSLSLPQTAFAQTTTPAPDAPALLTPAPLATPFDHLQVSPGNPLRAPRGAVPLPEQAPPLAADGKVELDLSAQFQADGPPIPTGLQWRVFHDEADQNGDLPLADDSTLGAPSFRLSPGGYVIHAVYGLASVSKHVVVEQSVREQLVLPAGALKLLAVVGERPIDDKQVTFKLAANEGGVERTVANGLRSNALVRLPAGMYHVVSNYGDANAVIEVDVRVEAGKLIEATVHHKAAPVNLSLLDGEGGPRMDNTAWSVLTPGGDVVRESINAEPSFVLAEGKYLAMARHDGRSYSREFTVVAGQPQQLDIVRGEASAVKGSPPGPNRPNSDQAVPNDGGDEIPTDGGDDTSLD